MKRTLKRLLSLIMTVVMFANAMPLQVFAADEDVYIPEIEIGEDILEHDVFYIASAAASIPENGGVYLLRIGRGGPADSESSALVKIADMTAKYGRDYVVRVRGERTEVDDPDGNFSLMEMMEGSDFDQNSISDPDEFADMMEGDPNAQAAYREGVGAALEYLSEASNLSEKYGDENPYASDNEEDGTVPPEEDGETISLSTKEEPFDPVQQAANLFTGQEATSQRLVSESDMYQDLQAIADVVTNVVVGASVELTFAPGETEKYLEIVPKNNAEGDGDRMFYIILGSPSGTTTNSAASSCALTIADDEEQEPSVVYFSQSAYFKGKSEDTVTVTVEREGALNSVVSVDVKTTENSTALAGRDYSQVDTTLVFPFGVSHLSIDIPVRSDYLTGEASFELALSGNTGCSLGEASTAAVHISGIYNEAVRFITGQKPAAASVSLPKLAFAGSSMPSAAGSDAKIQNTLATYKTLAAISLNYNPGYAAYGNGFSGLAQYADGAWTLQWKGTGGGSVGTVFEFAKSYWESFYLSGAEVNWWRSDGSGTSVKVALGGKFGPQGSYGTGGVVEDTDITNNSSNNYYFPYDSARDFGWETRYIYPHINAIDPEKQMKRAELVGYAQYAYHPGRGGDHPGAIQFINKSTAKEGATLKIKSIKPILRPFEIDVLSAPTDSLLYLKEDGTRDKVTTATTTDAEITEVGASGVFFYGDSFTIQTVAGTGVSQYAYMSGLDLITDDAEIPIATNDDPSVNRITYTLDTASMEDLIKKLSLDGYKNNELAGWYKLVKENPYARNTTSDGCPTYVQYNVRPKLSYVDSAVTLRNPYSFPVTMTISGKDYTVAAESSMDIKAPDGQSFHKGDVLAISDIKIGGSGSDVYTAAGVRYEAKFQSINAKTDQAGTWDFIDSSTIYAGGEDHRLCYGEIVIEPNLQEKGNKIVVRVKTSDLSKFDTTGDAAGILRQQGTEEGGYTYFTFADSSKTVSGRVYPITVTPKDSETVCVWEDRVSQRTYEGNTLYFTAGLDQDRNVITLHAETAQRQLVLEGTLHYANYNLRTGYEGNESNVPAQGATLAAGSAGSTANSKGFVSAGPISITGKEDRYIRYIVSVNGSDIVKETLTVPKGEEIHDPTALIDLGPTKNVRMDVRGIDYGSEFRIQPGIDEDSNGYYQITSPYADSWCSFFIKNYNPLDVSTIQWMKIRVKNVSGANTRMRFCVVNDTTGKPISDTAVDINLIKDKEWHEYVINLPETNKATTGKDLWTGTSIRTLYYYPLLDGTNGYDSIQVDYIGFFPDKVSAEAFNIPLNKNTALCDFGIDNAMNANIENNTSGGITYKGEKDSEGNDYYSFSVTNCNYNIRLTNTHADSIDDIQWVRVRAKNLSGAKSIALGRGGDTVGFFKLLFSMTEIPIKQDSKWHEYIINIPDASRKRLAEVNGLNFYSWDGEIEAIQLFPVQNGDDYTSGGSIQIDYIAFFDNEEDAKVFRGTIDDGVDEIDISANFPRGVSPVTSPIFSDIQITGKYTDNSYQIQNGASIPVVLGKSVDMSVTVKPKNYSFSMTGNDGEIIDSTETENPISVQFAVYDRYDNYKGIFEKVEDAVYNRSTRTYTFSSTIEFVEPEETEYDPNKSLAEQLAAASTGLIPVPGDRLYLRLVTDRLAQAESIKKPEDEDIIYNYQYSDVYTGMDFYQPASYSAPPEMGIKEPVSIEFGKLPLIGNAGMNLNFPFVNVGIMRIHQGYRIYIGFSPMQIIDMKKGSHITKMSGAGGQYWKELFSMAHPFDTFAGGIGEAMTQISEIRDAAKEAAENGTRYSTSSLGSPSWSFDLAVGMYFDFQNAVLKQGDKEETIYKFDGMGGYVAVNLAFSMAWYIILPVVFLPAYFGIELNGTVLGFLGADLNSEVTITYDDSLNGKADINDGITSLNGGVRGVGFVQMSFGVGLCGTLGIRVAGKLNLIANWEPTDPNGEWGFYTGIAAGIIVDLFLFSLPLVFEWAAWPMGSFERYADPDIQVIEQNNRRLMSASRSTSTMKLREGSGDDSMWLGDQELLMGAFRPNKLKEQILVADAYERPDAQLITLSDGESLALAFIDSDSTKDAAQRTTLKLATYSSGKWSSPVVVSNDGTADFQPSIAETKDGNLLVAWISTSDDSFTDVSTDEKIMDYLNSMEVYAAFIELDADRQIKTRNDGGVTVADTEVTRITNDHYTRTAGGATTVSTYYDSNPTVVCDMESGDAMIYYIKSGRSSLGDGQLTDYINPYTNDCVVCYMPFNAASDSDTDGRTVPAGWLTDNFYYSELGGNTVNEEFYRTHFSGQRFLAGPVNSNNERYTIPDFTAVSYNGLAVYAYTVDKDGINDTDADKELFLQVYDFRSHETKYRIALTDDRVADAMPQFFRSRVNTAATGGMSTGEENTHTKLFWYRNSSDVVYIDITALLRDGINTDGSLKTGSDDEHVYTYTDGDEVRYLYTEPRIVSAGSGARNASRLGADFKAVEDNNGNLYILWTQNVTDGEGNAAREIFGTGLVEYDVDETGPDGDPITGKAVSGWSKPYRITSDGFNNDEITAAMSGENLMVVHNRFRQTLILPEDGKEYKTEKVADYMPLQISEMALVGDTLEPCGSMETESMTLPDVPVGGENIEITVTLANNGMNKAQGYKLSLYAADANGTESQIGETIVCTDALVPGQTASHVFSYDLPKAADGISFRSVVQEMRDAEAQTYYREVSEYSTDPIKTQARYDVTDAETYQDEDGFHARFTVTNSGNAASSEGDTLSISIAAPSDTASRYEGESGILCSETVGLGIGESRTYDVPVSITPEMMQDHGYITARLAIEKEVVAQTVGSTEYKSTLCLSEPQYIGFDLSVPMNMKLADVNVNGTTPTEIDFSMDLGEMFDSGVEYKVEDLTVASVSNGRVAGLSNGTTTIYAVHTATGATTAAKLTVTGINRSDAQEPASGTAAVNGDDGSTKVGVVIEEAVTAVPDAPTEEQLVEIAGKAKETGFVTIDLSGLPEDVISAKIPAETVKAVNEIIKSGGTGLTIKLPGSSVSLDSNALAAVAAKTAGYDLALVVEPIDQSMLNDKQAEALADKDVRALYDIYMVCNSERIADLGGGTATVEVPVKLQSGQNPRGLQFWYVSPEGELEKNPTSASKSSVKFTAAHFSDYALTYDENSDNGDAVNTGDKPFMPYVIAFTVSLAVLMAFAVYLVRRKKEGRSI